MRLLVVTTLATTFTLSCVSIASGQGYPSKPIRIVTSAPAGANDIAIRIIGQELRSALGQPIVVENRGGASATSVAAQSVSKAAPDGHTLLFYSNSLWTDPLLRNTRPLDPVKDFAAITMAVSSPNIVVVHPSTPVKSIKQLIALARARPGDIDYSSGAVGSSNHLAAELFKADAGIKMRRVGYRGTPPALNALISGEVQVMFPVAAAATPHVQSGRLRALAVTSPKPSALVPGLPTVAASGLPGYESEMMMALFAPVETPPAIVQRLNQEAVRVLHDKDVKDKFQKLGVETIGGTPEELVAAVKSEIERLAKAIKSTGMSAN